MKIYAALALIGMLGGAILGSIGQLLESRISNDKRSFLPGAFQLIAAALLVVSPFVATIFVPETKLYMRQIQEALSNPMTTTLEWCVVAAMISIVPVIYVLITSLFYYSGIVSLKRWVIGHND